MAKTANAKVTLKKNGSAPTVSLQTSTDGVDWYDYTVGTAITLANIGDKVMFRGTNSQLASSTTKYNYFSLTGQCYVYGNIMSLINENDYTDPTLSIGDHAFFYLFKNCEGLYNHPEKTLELPATTLASSCYNSMFYGCTNLTTAPVLPAKKLTTRCYREMFKNCSSLNSVTCLATDISVSNSTGDWLSGVAATGTFTKASGVSWPSGNGGIPSGWTVISQ